MSGKRRSVASSSSGAPISTGATSSHHVTRSCGAMPDQSSTTLAAASQMRAGLTGAARSLTGIAWRRSTAPYHQSTTPYFSRNAASSAAMASGASCGSAV